MVFELALDGQAIGVLHGRSLQGENAYTRITFLTYSSCKQSAHMASCYNCTVQFILSSKLYYTCSMSFQVFGIKEA